MRRGGLVRRACCVYTAQLHDAFLLTLRAFVRCEEKYASAPDLLGYLEDQTRRYILSAEELAGRNLAIRQIILLQVVVLRRKTHHR